MFKKIRNLIVRGLLVALSLTLVSPTVCYAATINDLREYLGLAVIQDDSTTDENIYYYNGYSDTIEYNSAEIDKEALSIAGQANRQEMLAEYDSQLSILNDRLDARFEDGSTAYLITSTIDEIIRITNIVNSITTGDNKAVDNVETDNSYLYSSDIATTNDSVLQLIRQSMSEVDFSDISRLDYDIGPIGNYAESVVKNYFQIETPYGFTKHADEDEYTEAKLEGIELYAKEGDDIISQFNGVVVATGQDTSCNAEWIKIYSGNGLYTVYEHIHTLGDVIVGTKVSHGDKIAEAANTTEYETSKKNHILFRIELNGKLINPLLIYGNRGQTLYETWLTSHADDNVVEKGEEYYNKVDDSYKPKSDNVIDVLYPDFNLDN